MFGLGFQEVLILAGIGVLLFGRKLPDVARSLGKSVTEFKKGVSGLEEEYHSGAGSRSAEPEAIKPPARVTPAAPVFSEPAPAGNSGLPDKL